MCEVFSNEYDNRKKHDGKCVDSCCPLTLVVLIIRERLNSTKLGEPARTGLIDKDSAGLVVGEDAGLFSRG
jgi:hypothetical protein